MVICTWCVQENNNNYQLVSLPFGQWDNYALWGRILHCSISIVPPILNIYCLQIIYLFQVHKYDKTEVCEYTFICPLKSKEKGCFFCTRRKKFLYAYKNNLHRDADKSSSRTNIVLIVMFAFLWLIFYDKSLVWV